MTWYQIAAIILLTLRFAGPLVHIVTGEPLKVKDHGAWWNFVGVALVTALWVYILASAGFWE